MIIEEANKIFSEKTQVVIGLLSPTGDTLFYLVDTYCNTLRGGEHTAMFFSQLMHSRNLSLQQIPGASKYFISLLSDAKLVEFLNMLIIEVETFEETQKSTFKEKSMIDDELIQETVDDVVEIQKEVEEKIHDLLVTYLRN